MHPAHAASLPLPGLNESPSKKEGKSDSASCSPRVARCLNESPSEKEGKCAHPIRVQDAEVPSMKALPKRKGNGHTGGIITSRSGGASMKVYTSRY